MDIMNHHFGITLPASVTAKLDCTFAFEAASPLFQLNHLKKDAFYADGTPVEIIKDTLYPVYAAWYLGYPIPGAYLDVSSEYRKTASVAAVEWLQKHLPFEDVKCDLRHFNGETVAAPADGLQFCFPTTVITYRQVTASGSLERCIVPVIPIPDTFQNDESWEDATTPFYAEAQARLVLWCWQQSYIQGHRAGRMPEKAFLVRIAGNTPGDIQIRAVNADPKKDAALAMRVLRAYTKTAATGADPLSTLNRVEGVNWLEQKEQDEQDAYHVDSAEAHALVQQYMEVRSNRKTLEEQKDIISNEMNSIALQLAAFTDRDTATGTVDTPDGITYSVTHSRRRLSPPRPSAGHVRQFYPELLDCVQSTEYPKGRVSVDVL